MQTIRLSTVCKEFKEALLPSFHLNPLRAIQCSTICRPCDRRSSLDVELVGVRKVNAKKLHKELCGMPHHLIHS
jgi:hypothetical protein